MLRILNSRFWNLFVPELWWKNWNFAFFHYRKLKNLKKTLRMTNFLGFSRVFQGFWGVFQGFLGGAPFFNLRSAQLWDKTFVNVPTYLVSIPSTRRTLPCAKQNFDTKKRNVRRFARRSFLTLATVAKWPPVIVQVSQMCENSSLYAHPELRTVFSIPPRINVGFSTNPRNSNGNV